MDKENINSLQREKDKLYTQNQNLQQELHNSNSEAKVLEVELKYSHDSLMNEQKTNQCLHQDKDRMYTQIERQMEIINRNFISLDDVNRNLIKNSRHETNINIPATQTSDLVIPPKSNSQKKNDIIANNPKPTTTNLNQSPINTGKHAQIVNEQNHARCVTHETVETKNSFNHLTSPELDSKRSNSSNVSSSNLKCNLKKSSSRSRIS